MKMVKTMVDDSRLKNGHGFTLVEMLIVLFIIGALLLVIVPNLTDAGVDAQEKACDANKKLIAAQAENYYLNNGNNYPSDVGELVAEGYLSEPPACPVLAADDGRGTGGSSDHYHINSQGEVTCEHHG